MPVAAVVMLLVWGELSFDWLILNLLQRCWLRLLRPVCSPKICHQLWSWQQVVGFRSVVAQIQPLAVLPWSQNCAGWCKTAPKMNLMQWCTFPAVSHHRPTIIPKNWLFQHLPGLWSNQITVLVLMSHCFHDAVDKPSTFSHQLQASGQHKTQTGCKFIWATRASSFGWSNYPFFSAQSKHIMLCRLYSWSKGSFMIRSHPVTAVLFTRLIISDVNFSFSWASLAYATGCHAGKQKELGSICFGSLLSRCGLWTLSNCHFVLPKLMKH